MDFIDMVFSEKLKKLKSVAPKTPNNPVNDYAPRDGFEYC